MNDSQNANSAKCFSGFLRGLLCTGSLPTHPSDHLAEFDKTDFMSYPPKKTLKTAESTATTQVQALPPASTPGGIVARLMGLDSLPDINWVIPKQRRTTLDSINIRSRSVNSVDNYLPQFDLTQQVQHRRVRTSVSFREIPTFLDPQNQDFFVVCFDSDDEKCTEEGLKMMTKPEAVGFQEMKKVERSKSSGKMKEKEVVKKMKKKVNQENNKKPCTRKDEPKRVSVKHSSRVDSVLLHTNNVYRKPSASMKVKSPAQPVNLKEVSLGMKYAKKRENRPRAKKAEPAECSSVLNSSPVSVAIESGNSGKIDLNPTKKSTPKIDKCDYQCLNFIQMSNADDQEVRPIHITIAEKSTKTRKVDYCIKKYLVEVCRLTEEDTKGSNWPWIARSEVIKFEDFEDICFEFGQHILEMLLKQVVDELCK